MASSSSKKILFDILNDWPTVRTMTLQEGNTVQPRAVNLAYAEPCPDERSRHGFFGFASRVGGQEKSRVSAEFAGDAAERCEVRCCAPGLSTTCISKNDNMIEAETSLCMTLRDNGTAPASGYPRATALPVEGAHLVRRCSPFSKSEHLGKPRGFLRRCAPLCKVLTKNCASSNNTLQGATPTALRKAVGAASGRKRVSGLEWTPNGYRRRVPPGDRKS